MSQRSAFSAAASATAEVSEPPRPSVVIRPLGADALEAGDHRDLRPRRQAALELVRLDAADARLAVDAVGADRDLPAQPGAGLDAELLQRERQQADGHLLAGRDDDIVFARVVQRADAGVTVDQLVGGAGHGRDDDGDLVAGIDFAFDLARDILDAVDVGDRGAAEFQNDPRHCRIAAL